MCKYLCEWKAKHSNRDNAMPHIKVFLYIFKYKDVL